MNNVMGIIPRITLTMYMYKDYQNLVILKHTYYRISLYDFVDQFCESKSQYYLEYEYEYTMQLQQKRE